MKKIRIGTLISGGGTNMQAIVNACEKGTIDGEVIFVGADNHDAKGLGWADEKGIPTFVVDYSPIIKSHDWNKRPGLTNLSVPDDFNFVEVAKKQNFFARELVEVQEAYTTEKHFKASGFLITRVIAEAKLLEKMSEYDFDLLVLAGFMRNLTPYFIDRINKDSDNPRIMNIHPALLPSFPGVNGYDDTIKYGCKVGGCTVHFIDYGEDSGPIIGQRAIPVLPDDDTKSFQKRGLQEEYKLFPECIQLFAENRLKIESVEQNEGSVRKTVKILSREE